MKKLPKDKTYAKEDTNFLGQCAIQLLTEVVSLPASNISTKLLANPLRMDVRVNCSDGSELLGCEGPRDGHIPDTWLVLSNAMTVLFFIQTPVGAVANCLAVVTSARLCQRGDLTVSATVHIQAIALWDFSSLFMDGFLDNMLPVMWKDIGASSDWACRITTYLDWTTSRIAGLAVATAAVDRCISVIFPIFYKKRAGKRRFSLTLVALYAMFVLVSNSPLLIVMETNGAGCVRHFSAWYWDVFFALVESYGMLVGVPGAMILAANLTVFLHLRVKKTRLSGRAKSALYMVSASSLVSLSLMLVAGWAILNDYVSDENSPYTPEKNSFSNGLYRKLAQLLIGCTNSTNFFIYIAASSSFRRGFLTHLGWESSLKDRYPNSSTVCPSPHANKRKSNFAQT